MIKIPLKIPVSARRSGSPPNSYQLSLVTHATQPKMSSKFVDNFSSHPVDIQTQTRLFNSTAKT